MCLPIVIILIFLSFATSSKADDSDVAFVALDRYLQYRGGGVVRSEGDCPRIRRTNIEALSDIKSEVFDKKKSVAVLFTTMCDGGNRMGEYLVLTEGRKGTVVDDAKIGDMSFLVQKIEIKNGSIYLSGRRWRASDSHCCPSQKGILKYELGSKKQIFLENRSNE